MAMIKCPECGRQISEKAPVCPNCGVEIAGKITQCTQCGEVYFNEQDSCPNCHHHAHSPKTTNQINNTQEAAGQNAGNYSTPPVPPQRSFTSEQNTNVTPPTPPVPPKNEVEPESAQKQEKRHTPLIIGFIFALIVCAVCFYFYNDAKSSKEAEAYEFAMKSNDPLVLQTYLDNYKDASQAHLDSITARLETLKRVDNDWNNALVSGSKQALLDYLSKHPDSGHKAEAEQKIDSIDWAEAQKANSMDLLQAYLAEHPNGEYVDQANDALKKLKTKTIQPEDKTLVSSVMRQFFQAISSRNELGFDGCIAPTLSNFLGKQDATKTDVITFMNKIYKDDITSMKWRLNNDYKIDKKEVGDEQYEYTVNFSALQEIDRTDLSKEKEARYKIKAVINPDGMITSMSMTKILE